MCAHKHERKHFQKSPHSSSDTDEVCVLQYSLVGYTNDTELAGQTQCSQSRPSGFTFTGTPVSAYFLGSAVKAGPQPVALAIDTHLTLETSGSKH